jgi:hypothetical protein
MSVAKGGFGKFFTLAASPIKCAKNIFSWRIELRIVIWHIFWEIANKEKIFLRLSHLYQAKHLPNTIFLFRSICRSAFEAASPTI